MTRIGLGLALLSLVATTLASGVPAGAQAAGETPDLLQLQFDLYSLPCVNELAFTKEQLTQIIPLLRRGIEEQKTIAAKQAPVDAESVAQLVQIREEMLKGKVGRDAYRSEGGVGAKAMRNLESAIGLAHQNLPASKELLALMTDVQRDKLTRVTIMASRLNCSPPPPAPPAGPGVRRDPMTTALTALDRVRGFAEPEYQNRRIALAEGTVQKSVKPTAPDYRPRVEQLLKVLDQVRAMTQADYDANKRTIAEQHILAYVHEEGGGLAPPAPPTPMIANARPNVRALYDERVIRLLELKLKSMQ